MTGQFEWMDLDTDENEHSIEMHLPYIAKVMEKWVFVSTHAYRLHFFPFSYKHQFTIVPILVGSLSPEREACYGRILSSYLGDPQNLFIISSDFCHWGHRFRYTYYARSYGNIYQSIEELDRLVRILHAKPFALIDIVWLGRMDRFWRATLPLRLT